MRIMKKLVAAKMVEKPYSVNALYVLHGAHFATEQMREAPKYRLEKDFFLLVLLHLFIIITTSFYFLWLEDTTLC